MLALVPVSQLPLRIDLNRSDRMRSRVACSDNARPWKRDECAESISSERRTKTFALMTLRSYRQPGQRGAAHVAQRRPTYMKVEIVKVPARIDRRQPMTLIVWLHGGLLFDQATTSG